jgi:hypothetical protein
MKTPRLILLRLAGHDLLTSKTLQLDFLDAVRESCSLPRLTVRLVRQTDPRFGIGEAEHLEYVGATCAIPCIEGSQKGPAPSSIRIAGSATVNEQQRNDLHCLERTATLGSEEGVSCVLIVWQEPYTSTGHELRTSSRKARHFSTGMETSFLLVEG